MERKKIHMVGIGGIGISALAQLYVHQGHRVTGTNDNPSPQTLDRVRALGVPITVSVDPSTVPSDTDLIVYSDAWDTMEPQFMASVRRLGIPMLSYFEALGEATRNGTSIVVSGTNGKTTTTAMLAKILIDAGKEPTVIAGSIISEYRSNFVAGRPDLFVVEGCEYKRHFLHLHPTLLVITNIELDHTDYYRDLADMQDAFRSAIALVPSDGAVITNTNLPNLASVLADATAHVVPYQNVIVPDVPQLQSFNRENAQAAKMVTQTLFPEVSNAGIDEALVHYQGTWRRFEYKGTTKQNSEVYDDYAHHPTAVRGTIALARARFPDKHILVIFHPHLYSRTRDLMDDFVEALATADEVLFAPIYPAREKSIPGVTSDILAEKITARGVSAEAFSSLDSIYNHVIQTPNPKRNTTVIITMGAGDVYTLADKLVHK